MAKSDAVKDPATKGKLKLILLLVLALLLAVGLSAVSYTHLTLPTILLV